jgi:hypothetical protein
VLFQAGLLKSAGTPPPAVTTGPNTKGNLKNMKLEALEKASVAAHEHARLLEQKAQKSGAAARATKAKARQAKARLKLAKREVKQSRQAAKEAKGAFAEALRAAEKAVAKAASLEKKMQKSRKKGAQVHAKPAKPKHAPTYQRVAAKPHAAAAKPAPRLVSRAKPVRVLASEPAQPAALGREASIQVPRDLTPPPAAER